MLQVEQEQLAREVEDEGAVALKRKVKGKMHSCYVELLVSMCHVSWIRSLCIVAFCWVSNKLLLVACRLEKRLAAAVGLAHHPSHT